MLTAEYERKFVRHHDPGNFRRCIFNHLLRRAELFRVTHVVDWDVAQIHVVLNEKSRGLLGARELGLMKRDAILINTSRGPLVDEQALITALREKRIAGAGLDVFDREPLPGDHPLRQLDNVMATPHLGYVVREGYRTFYSHAVEDIKAWLAGSPVRVLQAGK